MLLDPRQPHLARQNPADYIEGLAALVPSSYTTSSFGIAGSLDLRGTSAKIEREEIMPTVPPVPGVVLEDYYHLIHRRFSNPKIGDTIPRLCLDGSRRETAHEPRDGDEGEHPGHGEGQL